MPGILSMFDRQRARFESQRLESTEDGDDRQQQQQQQQPPEGADVEEGRTVDLNTAEDTSPTETEDNNAENADNVEEENSGDEEAEAEGTDGTAAQRTALRNSTLAELEEERELTRRRSSACVMFSVFILFRLWVEAIQEGDLGLLLISLLGTSWTARWIQVNREREEELDRRIANYVENSNNNNSTVDRNDLRLLSFQAQLALAIMESQRQMMEGGGYGHSEQESPPGVSDDAKSKWEKFTYKADDNATANKQQSSNSKYGSLAKDGEDGDHKTKKKGLIIDDEEPHCSICLSEYEDDETLVKLPCGHIFHEECIASWTTNHTKCPLCNFDLESVAEHPRDTSSSSSASEDRRHPVMRQEFIIPAFAMA